MFENLNNKIKGLAAVELIGGIILSIIGGIILCISNLTAGVIVICLGCLASFVSALPVYALGEILDIAEQNQEDLQSVKKSLQCIIAKDSGEAAYKEKTEQKRGTWPYVCGKCGKTGPYENNCPSCGSSIKVFNINNN